MRFCAGLVSPEPRAGLTYISSAADRAALRQQRTRSAGGRRGRAALHELLSVTRDMRRLIQGGSRVEELQRQGLADGMRTLRQDGIEKVLAGHTSIEEVRATSNV